MTKIFKVRLLSLVCFMTAIGMLFSCEKDDEGSGVVELLSFGPTGALHGDTLRFIGNNLNKVTDIGFIDATVPQSDFIEQNSEAILVIVPQQAEQGYVTLKTSQGDIVSKTRLNLAVTASVASFTSEARPGENITITGNYLNWVNRVVFTNSKVVDTFVSKSMTQLVVKVPVDAQTGPLDIFYGGTEGDMITTDQALKVTLPIATGLSPNPVKHQINLTITGTNLDLAKQVLFTGVTTPVETFVSQSATQLVVKIPDSTKKGKITLVAASEVTTTLDQEVDLVLPVTTSLTPKPVDPEGELTINGTNLDLVTGIKFPGLIDTVRTFISKSATRIVVKLPAGTTKGKLTFTVLNSVHTVQSAQEMEIAGGPAEIPFKLLVYGDGFENNWVKWGGWGTASQDESNTEQAKSGSKAIKAVFNNDYGAVQLHPNTNFPVPGIYSTLRLSIYGGANATATSRIAVYLKDATDPTDAQKKVLTIAPGKYMTFEIPLTDFTNNPAKINELVIQNYGTKDLTIYFDEIGFY